MAASAPPSAAPPPPTWTPMPVAPAARPIPWIMLGNLAKIIGFVLFFVGIVIIVAFVSIPGSCISSAGSCSGTNTGFYSGALNAILAGKILVVLGLGGFIAGAGVKLHWGGKPAEGEDIRLYLAHHWFNALLFLVSIVLLLLIMGGVNFQPPLPPIPP